MICGLTTKLLSRHPSSHTFRDPKQVQAAAIHVKGSPPGGQGVRASLLSQRKSVVITPRHALVVPSPEAICRRSVRFPKHESRIDRGFASYARPCCVSGYLANLIWPWRIVTGQRKARVIRGVQCEGATGRCLSPVRRASEVSRCFPCLQLHIPLLDIALEGDR